MEFLSKLVEAVPTILAVMGALAFAAGAIAKITPNKTDDGIVAKIESILSHASTLFMKRPTGPSVPDESSAS